MSKTLNVPNQITLSRLGLAILFVALLAQYSQRNPQPLLLDIANALFIIAAITDILDGYLARKWGMETSLGRVLDPFVDKVLICGAFILFVGPGFVDESGKNVTGVKTWMVVLIVGRELLVTGLRGFSESQGVAFGASMWGKIKMWMQSVAAPVLMLLVAHESDWGSPGWADDIKVVIVWMTVLATLFSCGHYLFQSRQLLEQGDSP